MALLVIVAVAIVDTAWRYWRQRWRTFIPLSSFREPPATDYELAMLTAGRDLVVLTALVNLDSCGALELARRERRIWLPSGRARRAASIVASVAALELPADPIEAAVHRAVRPGNRSEESIRADPGVGAALDDLQRHLVATGLLDPEGLKLQLSDERWLRDVPPPPTLVGNELIRRLRKTHPVESVGTLVALFGESILGSVDPGLVRVRRVPRASWGGFFLPDFGGDGGEVDPGGTC